MIRSRFPATPSVARAPVIHKRIHRLSGDSPSQIQGRNYQLVGKAAPVAGDVGPGFHNWPRGHILQAPDTNALIRIRTPAPPDVARAPIFLKRRIRNNHAAAKPPL
jgi:hypothetical protein